MTKWKGWVSVHQTTHGHAGQQVAASDVYEFSLDDGDQQAAQTKLEGLWFADGRKASDVGDYAGPTTYVLNVEPIR